MTETNRAVLYPAGVRTLMTAQARRRREIESSLVERFERQGFGEIILPFVDYFDAYRSSSNRPSRESYRFTDREGELLFIRSDFTPMVARAIAPVLDDSSLPLGVYYRGDVVRLEPARLGRSRESFQIGAELIGDGSPDADFSILLLACESLAGLLGESPLRITLSDASLLSLLLDAANLSELQRSAVRSAASRRAEIPPGLIGPVDARSMRLIGNLATGRLTIDELCAFEPSREIGLRLSRVGEQIAARPFAEVIYALDESAVADYYTGFCFQIFADRSQSPVASGGRYDALYSGFGLDTPAAGFTLNIDVIEEAR